jgi:hypothetical protein
MLQTAPSLRQQHPFFIQTTTLEDFDVGHTSLITMLVRGHVETETHNCPWDKAQPLIDELLHEVAPNFAFPLALGAKSRDCVLSLSSSTALRSNILLLERY